MLLSHPHLRRDFDRFLLDLGTYGPPKNLKKLVVDGKRSFRRGRGFVKAIAS